MKSAGPIKRNLLWPSQLSGSESWVSGGWAPTWPGGLWTRISGDRRLRRAPRIGGGAGEGIEMPRGGKAGEVTAGADFILTVVTDDKAMRDIFTASGDNLLRSGTGRVFINFATVSPQVHLEVEAAAQARGRGGHRSLHGLEHHPGAAGNALSHPGRRFRRGRKDGAAAGGAQPRAPLRRAPPAARRRSRRWSTWS
jgi:hypothetical protein